MDFAPTLRVVLRGQGLTTMISQMDANGLGGLLNDTTTNHTVFAPTNDAFAAVPPSAINAAVLNYHLTDDVEMLSSFVDGILEWSHLRLPSLLNNTQALRVSVNSTSNTVSINNATILSGDYTASNGVVQILNSVLSLPPYLSTILQNATVLSNLTSLLNSSGLLNGVLASSPGLTLFAPTNMAFSQVNPQVLQYLGRPLAASVLQNVLSYHIINGATTTPNTIYYRDTIPMGTTNFTMMSGDVAQFNKTGVSALTINNQSNATVFNVLAANGVMHGINTVLFPPSFVFDLQKALVGVDATGFLNLLLNSSLLAPLLNGATNYTIFAPNNAALAALQQNMPTGMALLQMLQYHIVPGTYFTTNFTNGQVLPTLLFPMGLNGAAQVLRVNTSLLTSTYINNANITMANYTAVNGVVHVIDTVLVPPMNISTILATNPAFSTFNSLVQASGLAALVQGNSLSLSLSLSLFIF